MALSLCRVLGVALYFSEGFLEAAAGVSAVAEVPQPLGETVVSCTTIEVQIVFEMLLALVTGQLAIAGQLEREVHPWNVGLLLGSGGWR